MRVFNFFFGLLTAVSLLSYLVFIIYAPVLQGYYPYAKQLLFYVAVAMIPFSVLQPSFREELSFLSNHLVALLLLYPVLMIGIHVYFNSGGMSEISTFISIYFVLAAITKPNILLPFMKATMIVSFMALGYEFLRGSYIYEDMFDMGGEHIRSINISSYGDVGFRPKGLFAGPLDASSYLIFSALIFRNRPLFLGLCFASALLANGRLAILVCAILILSKFKFSGKQIVYLFLSASGALLFLVQLQEATALLNLLSVFDLSSPSNIGRIVYTITGVMYLLDLSLVDLLFGSSDSFLEVTDGHSAESGFVSTLIVHGLAGFLFLSVIFSGVFNRLKRDTFVLIIIFLCLCIYRFDVGVMRSFFLYYLLLYASMESFYGGHR